MNGVAPPAARAGARFRQASGALLLGPNSRDLSRHCPNHAGDLGPRGSPALHPGALSAGQRQAPGPQRPEPMLAARWRPPAAAASRDRAEASKALQH